MIRDNLKWFIIGAVVLILIVGAFMAFIGSEAPVQTATKLDNIIAALPADERPMVVRYAGIGELERDVYFDGTYYFEGKGEGVVILAYEGNDKEVYVPSDFYTVPTVELADNSFRDKGLTAVTIPDNIETIGNDAFAGNDLVSIFISSTVIDMEPNPFRDNNFGNRDNISITINPANPVYESIDGNIYNKDEEKLVVGTNPIIEDGTKVIGEGAYDGSGVEDVVIPESVTTIEDGAFDDNDKPSKTANAAEEFTIDSETGSITGYNGNGDKIVIPSVIDGVKIETIKTDAFEGKKIKELIISDGIKEIEEYAFSDKGIDSLTLPSSLKEIGTMAFFENNLTSLIIPDSVAIIGETAFGNNNISSLKLGSGLVEIKRFAFQGNGLGSVVIPAGVKVGQNAFVGAGLHTITLNDGVSLDTGVFDGNPIKTVNINGSVSGSESSGIGYSWMADDSFNFSECVTEFVCEIKLLNPSTSGTFTLSEEITQLDGPRRTTSHIINGVEYVKEPVEINRMKTFILK